MEKQHWLQELFPPRFSAEDLFVRDNSQVLLLSERFAASRAKRIECIYQQEIKYFQEQKKTKRKAHIKGLIVHEVNPVKDQIGQNHLQLHKSDNSCKTPTHRMEEQCIRSAGEQKVSCQTTCQDMEQCKMKAQLALAHSQMAELKANCKELAKSLEMKGTELCKAQQELQDKALKHIHNVQEICAKDLQIQGLREDLWNELMNASKLRSEVHRARLEAQELQLGKERLLSSLEQQALQYQLEKTVLVEKIKEQSVIELKKLQMELDVVKAELRAEKHQHVRSKKDLELLRKHFASLLSSNPAEAFNIEFLNK
ncbi:coiled-coil domain-containing protein 160 [Pristis pectinata]|uniref:coiled-coil domain-containing protein 160 n=1 Tax=Pristis pectinata TaxID=685728 RepID=UPI00223CF1A6|nr:coiled-coil domain-containing protein 160 [Pristis pectinata]